MKSRLPGLGVSLDVRALTEHVQIPWFDPQQWKKRGFQRILQKVQAGEMVWRTKIHLLRVDTSSVLRASTLGLHLPVHKPRALRRSRVPGQSQPLGWKSHRFHMITVQYSSSFFTGISISRRNSDYCQDPVNKYMRQMYNFCNKHFKHRTGKRNLQPCDNSLSFSYLFFST